MGSVQFGIPRDLVLSLKAKHKIDFFVETGTLVADTTIWAANHFEFVTTVDIEPNQEAIKKIAAHNKGRNNIASLSADSAGFLESSSYSLPVLFWLDAHTNESCPVLREIAAINTYAMDHVILVDDYRLFGDLTAWPKPEEVIAALQDNGRRTVKIIEDVIVAEPWP